jgi:GMP synthase (glutamine-hydrolysing)
MRLLVIEGNTREGREAYRAGYGRTAGEAYAERLRALAPEASCDIVCPADADCALAAPLTAYDGAFVTGSALNLYDGGPEIARQLDLARAVYRARVPFFGSCWGLQLACAAAGGNVLKNPRGREIGIARRISLTEAGRAHPLLAGRPPVYEALCSHIDIVELPAGGVALAGNDLAPVQAAEIVFEGGVFWGVQYHPEYDFAEVAAIIERRADALAREGFGDAVGHARELRTLDGEPPAGAAWRLGLSPAVLTAEARALELANFLERRVRARA